jgi:hypothetical protein
MSINGNKSSITRQLHSQNQLHQWLLLRGEPRWLYANNDCVWPVAASARSSLEHRPNPMAAARRTIGFLPRNYAHHYLQMSLLECMRSAQEHAS